MPEPSPFTLPGRGQAIGRATSADCTVMQQLSAFSVHTDHDGNRTVVTVCGDLSLATEQPLQDALRAALTHADQGIDLDLSDVLSCDYSGLNTLLNVQQQALARSKTARIRSLSPAAARILNRTDTQSLFTPDSTPGAMNGDLGSEPVPRRTDRTRPDPRVEAAQLRRALDTRDTIDLARGILMATFTLSPEEAWHVLVTTSQNTNTKLHRTAAQLVESVRGEALPAATQKQLSTAVARLTATRDDNALPEPPQSSPRPAHPQTARDTAHTP